MELLIQWMTIHTLTICLNTDGIDTFMFLCMLVWPTIEVYWIALVSLFVLLLILIMEERKLAEMAGKRAEALYYAGNLDFYEALSVDLSQRSSMVL